MASRHYCSPRHSWSSSFGEPARLRLPIKYMPLIFAYLRSMLDFLDEGAKHECTPQTWHACRGAVAVTRLAHATTEAQSQARAAEEAWRGRAACVAAGVVAAASGARGAQGRRRGRQPAEEAGVSRGAGGHA